MLLLGPESSFLQIFNWFILRIQIKSQSFQKKKSIGTTNWQKNTARPALKVEQKPKAYWILNINVVAKMMHAFAEMTVDHNPNDNSDSRMWSTEKVQAGIEAEKIWRKKISESFKIETAKDLNSNVSLQKWKRKQKSENRTIRFR